MQYIYRRTFRWYAMSSDSYRSHISGAPLPHSVFSIHMNGIVLSTRIRRATSRTQRVRACVYVQLCVKKEHKTYYNKVIELTVS